MAKPLEEYQPVVVESYRPASTSGLHGDIHIRAVSGQGYPDDTHVECSKALSRDFPVGTRFLIEKAKLTKKENGRPFLYTHYTWRYDVLRESEPAAPGDKPVRAYKFKLPDNISREDMLSAISAYDNGVHHLFGRSTVYDILHGGKRYPPKAIVGIAASNIVGEPFKPDDFSGGIGSKCFRILEDKGFLIITKGDIGLYPDEVNEQKYVEGSVHPVAVNRYERDPKARSKCIQHYGALCQVCDFDFGKTYGPLGDGFIHVHHIVPVSEIGTEYEVHPIEDLRPVCPNCHAMLHKRTPPLSIKQLRHLIGRE